jgi:hypothetical protein
MKFKAVIVETRIINLVEVIKDHLKYLPSKYKLHIFVSDVNKHLVEDIDFGRDTEITVLKNNITSQHDYNVLLTSLNFWESLNCDKVLTFQSDSGLLREGIEEFEEYDWVGAPWPDSEWSKGEYWRDGSNGGLSLRTVSKMIECLRRYKWSGKINEDVYFYTALKKLKAKLSKDINQKFSVESVFQLGTLGYHAIDKYLSKEEVDLIMNQYKK